MIAHVPGTIKKLKRTPWRFQKTFRTPLPDLTRFVAAIAAAQQDLTGGSLVIEEIVFEPKQPPAFISSEAWRSMTFDTTVSATSADSAQALLVAALSNWIDFYFIFTPKPFVIYADHDEYCTFFANSRSNLNGVCESLSQAGFQVMEGYERKT